MVTNNKIHSASYILSSTVTAHRKGVNFTYRCWINNTVFIKYIEMIYWASFRCNISSFRVRGWDSPFTSASVDGIKPPHMQWQRLQNGSAILIIFILLYYRAICFVGNTIWGCFVFGSLPSYTLLHLGGSCLIWLAWASAAVQESFCKMLKIYSNIFHAILWQMFCPVVLIHCLDNYFLLKKIQT